MSITLNGVTLDPGRTAVREWYETVGGRDRRRIEVQGSVEAASRAKMTEKLDAILAAASAADYSAALSVRPGRVIRVRRIAFTREPAPDSPRAAFTLQLESEGPFEYSEAVTEHAWPIADSGAVLAIEPDGNAPAPVVVTLEAESELVRPAIGDGERAMEYQGAVGVGAVIAFDGVEGEVTLDGEDVTPYSAGEFPWLEPGGTTLTFTAESGGAAQGEAVYRNRWW
ncbi:MAG: phage distal tail protein [Candidatus Hydrogenedentota bacterium]